MRKVCSRVLKRAYCISCVFCIMCTSYYILISSWRNEENETYWGFLSFYHYCFGVFAVPRSSRPEVICKKCVLRNFTKFKVAGLSPATLLRKRLWHRCFPVNFAKISENSFFHGTPLSAASVFLKESNADYFVVILWWMNFDVFFIFIVSNPTSFMDHAGLYYNTNYLAKL